MSRRPGWWPQPSADARELRSVAADASRPRPVREQAALELKVYHGPALPDLGGWDAGARGPARGPVERAEVLVEAYDARTDAHRAMPQAVVRRARGRVVALLPRGLAETAERYAALMERIGAVRAIAEGSGGCGVSDGGAVARMADASRVSAARAAVGTGRVDLGRVRHPDRAQRAVTAMALVDAVVLDGQRLQDVLARHGWPRCKRRVRALSEALVDALGRMAAVLG